MPDDELPREADFDQVNSSLNEGLKTCRSMITYYRAFLSNDESGGRSGDENGPDAAHSFENDSRGN